MYKNTLWRAIPLAAILLVAAVGTDKASATAPPASDTPTTTTEPATTTPDTTSAPVAATPVAAISTVVLPLPVPLTVTVSTSPDGSLANVSVDPADGLTATELRPGRVLFEAGSTGVKVTVQSRGNRQSVSARAGSLAEISGTGSWSGDVFSNGTTTTVTYTVQPLADGSPDISGVTTSDPTAVISPVAYHTGEDDDEDRSSARVSVTFSNGSQSRTLTIRASVSNEPGDDTETGARVSVTLGRVRGEPQDVATAAGAKNWSGMLCNGSQATVSYTVNTDGTLSDVSSTPSAIRSEVRGREAELRFSDNERIRIRVRSTGAQLTVNVDPAFRCNFPPPSVNTPTSLTDNEDDEDDDNHESSNDDEDDEDSNHSGKDKGRGGKNDDKDKGRGGKDDQRDTEKDD